MNFKSKIQQSILKNHIIIKSLEKVINYHVRKHLLFLNYKKKTFLFTSMHAYFSFRLVEL